LHFTSSFLLTTTEIRIGQTVVGATSGASGRVSKVTVQSGLWEVAANPAVGTLTFYSVTGAFVNNESLQVSGATRAISTSADSDADIDLSWFARNAWYRHVFYAVANNYAWTGSGTCSDLPTVTCLQVANMPDLVDPLASTKQRALLVLMGQRVQGQTRPGAANGEFDDQFTWITVGELYGRLIAAGKLP
jgi:hypothetical protein